MPGINVPQYFAVPKGMISGSPISEMEAWLQNWLVWIPSKKGTLSKYNHQARLVACGLCVVAHRGITGNNMDPLSSPEIKLPRDQVSEASLERYNPGPQP